MTSEIGKRIKALREAPERNWTQADLARRANTNRVYIAQLETGFRKPGRDTLVALAAAFGLTIDALIADAPATEPSELAKAG